MSEQTVSVEGISKERPSFLRIDLAAPICALVIALAFLFLPWVKTEMPAQ